MVLSHRILSLRGTIFHVLSRIVDAGLDYTNRTNFIAHHVVFQPHELQAACSPADYLLYWPGWLSTWQGEPAWTDDQAASVHDIQTRTSLPAENWGGWSGTPSNASLLFEASKPRDAALLVEPAQESALIYLFAESLLLLKLNGDDRGTEWQVPFTTFFQSKDEVVDFRWRGIWPKSDRTKAERGALLLDLRNPSGFPPSTGPLADFAATGIAPATVSKPDLSTPADEEIVESEAEPSPLVAKSKQKRAGSQLHNSQRTQYRRNESLPEVDTLPWYERWKWALLAGGGGFLLLVGAFVLALIFFTKDRNSSPAPVALDTPRIQLPSTPVNTNAQPQHSSAQTPTDDTAFKEPSKAPVAATAPLAEDPVMKSLDKSLERDKQVDAGTADIPKTNVYILTRGEGSEVPLPDELISKLVAWGTDEASRYSLSFTKFILETNARPKAPSKDQFSLVVQKDRFMRFLLSQKKISIDGPTPAQALENPVETLFLQFNRNDEKVSVVIINTATDKAPIVLPKFLFEISPDDITLAKNVRDSIGGWKAFSVDGTPAKLQIRLTSTRLDYVGVQDNPSFTWGDAVKQATSRLNDDTAKQKTLAAKQAALTEIVHELQGISFKTIAAPLQLKGQNTDSMDSYINSSAATFDPTNNPILIQYATQVLTNLNRIDVSDPLPKIDGPKDKTMDAWKAWLTNVPTAIHDKYKSINDGGKVFDDGVKTFCAVWSAQFAPSVVNDSRLWQLTSNPIVDLNSVTSDLKACSQAIVDDQAKAQPIQSKDMRSEDVVISANGKYTPLISFQGDDFFHITRSDQGAGK